MNIGPEDFSLDRKASGVAADTHAETSADPGLEAALRHALRPTSVPPGFADRVLARALAGDTPHPLTGDTAPPLTGDTVQPLAPGSLLPSLVQARPASDASGKLLHWPQSRPWITGLVAAGLVAGVLEGGLALHHLHVQGRRTAQATREFQATERVTDRALAQARDQLQRAGVPLTLD